jgi:hypothetical protein
MVVMRSYQAVRLENSTERDKHKYICTLAGIPLSLSEVIAFYDLEFNDSKSLDEIKYQDLYTNLSELEHKKQKIALFISDEQMYYDNLIIHKNIYRNQIKQKKIEEDKQEENSLRRILGLKQEYKFLENCLEQMRLEQIKKYYRCLAKDKRLFALKIANFYETGKYGDNVASQHLFSLKNGIYSNRPALDEWKTTQYLTQTTGATYNPLGFGRTSMFYHYSGLFSAERLFVLRTNNILKHFNKDFIPRFSNTLFPFPFLGFSYGLELLFDIGVLIKTFIQGKSVKDAFYKDDRPSRMANSLVWLTCNIVCFIISGGIINAVVNLAAFAFDVGNEYYRTRKELKKYEDLLFKIEKKIKILQTKIDGNSKDLFLTQKNELQKLRCIQNELLNKIKSVKSKRNWVIASTTGLLVGMVLMFFPPAFIPYAAVVGSIIALTSGSIFIGFGKRAVEWGRQLKNWISPSPIKKPRIVLSKLQVLNNIIKKVSIKKYEPMSVQMATLTLNETQDLRVSLGLYKNDSLWQQQLKDWTSNAKLKPTAKIISHTQNDNPSMLFYDKSRATFLQTLQHHLLIEKQLSTHTDHSVGQLQACQRRN